MKTYLFTVVVEEDHFEDGRKAYHAYCPALKGASTWGYTREEALKNIREVVEMTIESMKEHNSGCRMDRSKFETVRALEVDISCQYNME